LSLVRTADADYLTSCIAWNHCRGKRTWSVHPARIDRRIQAEFSLWIQYTSLYINVRTHTRNTERCQDLASEDYVCFQFGAHQSWY